MKALIVKEDGLIYVNEVPEGPNINDYGDADIIDGVAYKLAKDEYQKALASAKDSAILVADQEKARELVCNVLKSLRWNKPGIYPMSLQWEWEVKEEVIGVASNVTPFGSVTEYKKVAILKESTPSTEQESQEEKFLLHLVDVVACFATEQNMFYATKTRKELIQKARETFKPESHERTTL